ncbi:MAG: fasciclin domain-containing protein [Ferruginibacter sp.]
MKSIFLSKTILPALLLLTLTGGLASCDKDDNITVPPPATITDQVSAGANLTLLKSAVIKAGLAATLSGTGPFTVFAPNDTAFAASGITSSVINTLTATQLETILLYHTLGSKVLAVDVPAGPNAKVVTANGDSVFVTKNASGVFVNGIQVVKADLLASNGIIHEVARVLLPPVGNIVAVASADTGFSFLVAAVVRASTGSTNVAAVLSSGKPLRKIIYIGPAVKVQIN